MVEAYPWISYCSQKVHLTAIAGEYDLLQHLDIDLEEPVTYKKDRQSHQYELSEYRHDREGHWKLIREENQPEPRLDRGFDDHPVR